MSFFDKDEKVQFSNELDTTITFRVNSELKSEFEKLCKSEHSNISRELNTFMRKAVSKKQLAIEYRFY